MTQTTAQPKFDNASNAHAYDEVPYISHAFPQTNPLLLQGIAKLFGLSVPDPKKARILEIGCASGGNILSIASRFPDSKCIGIDYSQRQIELGQEEVRVLGISNLELKHMSVMDVTKEFGTFDYIICHGVLSWVPPEVQEKILEVCSANLSQDGIAFVSYNTLPGWNNVRSVRDMMLYHTARFTDAPTKANQARLLLKFVGDAMKANNNPMADFLEREFTLLSPHPDSYLLHDHLEENNFPFYFHELMARADSHGLQYLADASLETMFSGNFPEETAKILATSDDLVRTEQYMDFINNRRFRNTLLCHKDRILNRNIQPDTLRDGWVVSIFIYPQGFGEHDVTSKQSLQFKSPAGMSLTTDDPLIQALLQVLMEKKTAPVRVTELFAQVRDKLKKAKYVFKDKNEEEGFESQLGLYLIRYMFIGAIAFFMQEPPFVSVVSKRPKISKLVRHQAPNQNFVSGLRQDSVNIELLDKLLIPYVDGTNDQAALLQLMLPHFTAKDLVMNENGAPVEDPATIKERMVPVIADRLKRYADLGLFEK